MINKLLNNTSKDYYVLAYLIWIIFYILINTNNFNYEETIIFGAADGENYLSIASASPKFSEEIIPYHHAQRFIIPYIIGYFSNFFNIDNYFLIFKNLSILFISFFLFLIFNFYKKNKKNIYLGSFILITSILLLNPYFIKYYFALPTLLNDLIFINLLFLFCQNFTKDNNIKYFTSILSLLIKQTGILMIFVLTLQILFNNKEILKKRLYKIFFLFSLSFIFININNFYATNVSNSGFDYNHIFGIFHWIKEDFSLPILIKFILYPLLSFSPAILLLFFLKDKIQLIKFENKYLLILLLIMIIQPYLGGPTLTSNNIVRLVSLSYPIIFFLTINNQIKYLTKFNIVFFISILFLHLWNLHPTYSILSFFS